MDSVSQFALGAAVGVAVMGRRTAYWKAALWGGICGTLPDLDVVIDHGDPVANMTRHRAETHAFFWQTLAAPVLAAGIAAIHRRTEPFRSHFPRWLLAVWLVLVTHSLLDFLTVYGTQLAHPFSEHPFGLGSIFIIDPLYTLPLIVGLVAGARTAGARRYRWNRVGLALSTLYLGWSLAAQAYVTGIVREQLATAGGGPVERVMVTPTAFNTVLWRVLVMREDSYDEGFRSLVDGRRPIRFDRFPRNRAAHEATQSLPAVARIAWFSRGFFRMDVHPRHLAITDLRMGQEPHYIFSFLVATRTEPPHPIVPVSAGGRGGLDVAATFDWLLRRAAGAEIAPPRIPQERR
jgi:inner membrane protein